ncbi:MAG TPA: helix-turn-helix domain-containing protein [Steroidobacteraceae bacterium]
MGRALFEHADFLEAARALATEQGPAAVTVGAVTQHLGAPIGSFYHRFASRDVLLGELWLNTVLAFQVGFVAAIEAGDGLAAALHTPRWARANLKDACFLLLYHRDDFVRGKWPEALKVRVAAQARQVESCLKQFAVEYFGGTNSAQLRRASFVLLEVPLVVIRPHLRRTELPPTTVDELISTTYTAIVYG